MNKDRRHNIDDASSRLDKVGSQLTALMRKFRSEFESIHAELTEIADIIETCKDEEQEYYDNMPESFQNGAKGEDAEERVRYLEDAYDNMDTVKEQADTLLEAIDELEVAYEGFGPVIDNLNEASK